MKLVNFKLLDHSIAKWFIVTALFSILYLLIIIRIDGSDPFHHAKIIYLALKNNTFPAQFIFYGLTYIISFIVSPISNLFIPLTLKLLGRLPNTIVLEDFMKYFGAIVLIISVATTTKLFLTQYIFVKFFDNNSVKLKMNVFNPMVVALGLILIQPIIFFNFNQQYLGYLGYNVWHNSTTIALMPIVLWTFLLVHEWLESENISFKLILYIIVSSSIGIFIKPSYFFIFMFAFPLINFFAYQLKAKFFHSLYVVAIPAIFIVIQYYLIYKTNGNAYGKPESGIEIAPFKLWNSWSHGKIIWCTISSYLFIISVFIILFRKLINNKLYLFSIFSVFGGILIFILFKETGSRANDGNFFWQIFPANYLLYLLSVIIWVNNYSKLAKWKNNVMLILFCSHVIFGIEYILKIIITKSFT